MGVKSTYYSKFDHKPSVHYPFLQNWNSSLLHNGNCSNSNEQQYSAHNGAKLKLKLLRTKCWSKSKEASENELPTSTN